MDRIPLPPHIVQAQQRITELPNGEFARDRLMVVHQKEIVPVVFTDPMVSEYVAGQMGRQRIEDAVAGQMLFIIVSSALILFTLIPAIIYIGCKYF